MDLSGRRGLASFLLLLGTLALFLVLVARVRRPASEIPDGPSPEREASGPTRPEENAEPRPSVTRPGEVLTGLRVRVDGLPRRVLSLSRLVVLVDGEEIRAPYRDEGRFVVWNLPAERPHDLHLAFGPGPAEVLLAEDILLERGEVRVLDVVLEDLTVVTGRVKDAKGRPLADVRLTLLPVYRDWRADGVRVRARTGRDGRYAIAEPEAGGEELRKLVVDAVDRGFAAEERLLRLQPGAITENVRLLIGLPIAGRVVDAEGCAVAGAAVHLEEIIDPGGGASRLPVRGLVRTNLEGRFEDDAYRPGRYRIAVRGTYRERPFVVLEESVPAGRENLTIRFEGFGGLSLRFRDARTGAPLPVRRGAVERFWPGAAPEDAYEEWETFARVEEVVIEDLPAGRYQVRLNHPGYRSLVSDLLVVEAGHTLGPLAYELEPLR